MSRTSPGSIGSQILQTGDIEIGAVEIKDGATDTRATVGANGLHVDVQTSALPTGAATAAKQLADGHSVALSAIDNAVIDDIAANQTDASQKTQVVDGSGNIIGATSNALDINIKSGNPTTITATQSTATSLKTQAEVYQGGSAVATANPLEVTLPSATVSTLTPPSAITGFATSAKQDTLLTELQLKADLTETQPVSLASVPSHAVTNAGTFAVQAAESDGANVTLGAKADAKSTATDTTEVTAMQVLKEISYMEQNPASRAVTFTGSTDVATQTTLSAINTKLVSGTDIGDVTINNSTGAAAVNIQDGGNTITVDGSVGITETAPSTLVAFVTDIPTAGSRVQLASNTIAGGVIQAPSTNTGNVYIGGSTVSSSVFGAELQPGQSTGIAIDNTNKIYIDAATNGDDVAFIGS